MNFLLQKRKSAKKSNFQPIAQAIGCFFIFTFKQDTSNLHMVKKGEDL